MKLLRMVSMGICGALLLAMPVMAQTKTLITPTVTAKGVAIYGWKDTVPTALYVKNEHTLLPIASLTKLVTAKIAQELYLPDEKFIITRAAASTQGITNGITIGAQFTRDDLLKALLVNSSNDAATALMEPVGSKIFLDRMNEELHVNNYTLTNFTNPSGLDPKKKGIKSNRMTPYHMTRLLNDIYQKDPTLVDIMAHDIVAITDLRTNILYELKQTNALYRDDIYKDKVIIGKTGLTNLAGQNLAFITQGTDDYDYITVVFLGSKSRHIDSRKILDWIASTYTSEAFGG